MNDEGPMTNDEGMMKSKDRNACAEDSFWNRNEGIVREAPETKRVCDLEERTAPFGEAVIDFVRMIPQEPPRSLRVRHSSFVILSEFDIRISSFAPFVFRHFPHAP
jgi:hypothetical protein